ncbi:MAG: AMP-dependent synthetase/ligase [Aeromonadaceae bacterium]
MNELHLVRVFRQRIEGLKHKAAQRVQQDGQWRDISWQAFGRSMDYLAQALIRLGLQPQQSVGIFARNMPEWTQADLGILAARGVVVPIYPTNTLEQTRYIIRDAGIRILFVGEQSQYDMGVQLLQEGAITQLIALDEQVNLHGCSQAMHFADLLRFGNHAPSADELQSRAAGYQMADLLTLVYTSGTTGEPKGVMLDFANLAAVFVLHDQRVSVGHSDVSLCLLPLSHVYERFWSYYVLYRGALNVYIRDPQSVMSVLAEVRPTVMCAVPRVYEKAYNIIHGKVAVANPVQRAIFNWAKRVGLKMLELRYSAERPSVTLRWQHKLADTLVFAKLRQRFGGRVRFLPVGGARLADEINLFFNAAGLNILYGYGMTETSATVSCPEDASLPIGTIGKPFDGLEIRLGEEKEILVKGPTVMRGYYNKPEETAKVFTEDGFFRTGDAGDLDAQGRLIFTERLKELMKTSNGKYVAPQLVEGTLSQDRFIEQIAIIADARHFVSALIVPCYASLEEYARSIGISYHSQVELLRHSKVVEFFEGRINAMQQELAKYEQVKRFTLLPRAFSMEKGELTPTLKLRRKVIEKAFGDEIEAMYRAPR